MGKRRILVVDDSEVIRNLLCDYLGDLGHEVETAVDGQAGAVVVTIVGAATVKNGCRCN